MMPSGILGPEWETELENAITEWLSEIINEVADKKTGEIPQSEIEWFRKNQTDLRKEAQRRLIRYANHAAWFRKDKNMRPFDWQYESIDRVRQALSHGYANLPKFRKEKPSEQSLERSTEIQNTQGWAIDDPDPTSCVGAAYAHYQRTGEYPETKAEGINAIFADLERRHKESE